MIKSKVIKTTSKINPRLNYWANLLLIFSILMLLLLSYLIYQRFNPQKLAFNLPEATVSESKVHSSKRPAGIKINSLNLELPIVPTQINGNEWEASTKGVSHLNSSVIPGEKGNSILYAHNWPNLLGNLKKINTGDNITIIYSDNSHLNFEVEYLSIVSPSDISVLKPSRDNRITLYTCTGFLDSKRLVVVAKLLNS